MHHATGEMMKLDQVVTSDAVRVYLRLPFDLDLVMFFTNPFHATISTNERCATVWEAHDRYRVHPMENRSTDPTRRFQIMRSEVDAIKKDNDYIARGIKLIAVVHTHVGDTPGMPSATDHRCLPSGYLGAVVHVEQRTVWWYSRKERLQRKVF